MPWRRRLSMLTGYEFEWDESKARAKFSITTPSEQAYVDARAALAEAASP